MVARALALCVLAAVLSGGRPAHADPRLAYVPQVTCAVQMGDTDEERSCSAPVAAGTWHLDADAAYVLNGELRLRVEIPDGRYAETACSVSTDPSGGQRYRCYGTFAGLGEGAGSRMSSFDGHLYMHVALPQAGTVTLSGGRGLGAALRGTSA